MHEGDDRSRPAHPLVVQRTFDMLCHDRLLFLQLVFDQLGFEFCVRGATLNTKAGWTNFDDTRGTTRPARAMVTIASRIAVVPSAESHVSPS